MSNATPHTFSDTRRFKQALSLIGGVGGKKLRVVLSRVLAHLSSHDRRRDESAAAGDAAEADAEAAAPSSSIFTEAEEAEVRELLGLSAFELETVVDGSSYVFETAAYHDLSPEALRQSLEAAGLPALQATVFARGWAEGHDALVAHLGERQLGAPLILESVDWRLQMEVDRRELRTVLRLGLGGDESLTAEFDGEQLQDLADQLERIQAQLDALAAQ